MKIAENIGGLWRVGAVVLWLTACSGGGGAPSSDAGVAVNQQASTYGKGQGQDQGQGASGSNPGSGVGNSGTGVGDSPVRSDGARNAGDGVDFPIVTAQDQQSQVRVAYLPTADRFLAVWNDLRVGEGWQVYGRLVNTEGGEHGPLKAFSPSGVEPRTAPGIAHDPATGRSLVVWGRSEERRVGKECRL